MFDEVQKYNKALVPILVMVVLGMLSGLGVSEDMTIKDVVTLVVTGGLVWLIPNKKA